MSILWETGSLKSYIFNQNCFAQNNVNIPEADFVILRKSNTVEIQICSHALELVTHSIFKWNILLATWSERAPVYDGRKHKEMSDLGRIVKWKHLLHTNIVTYITGSLFIFKEVI